MQLSFQFERLLSSTDWRNGYILERGPRKYDEKQRIGRFLLLYGMKRFDVIPKKII